MLDNLKVTRRDSHTPCCSRFRRSISISIFFSVSLFQQMPPSHPSGAPILHTSLQPRTLFLHNPPAAVFINQVPPPPPTPGSVLVSITVYRDLYEQVIND